MFKKRRREDRLEKSGVRAKGVVLEVRSLRVGRQSHGYQLYGQVDEELVHLRVRVEPEGEQSFEVEDRVWVSPEAKPQPGAQMTVLYDPADHSHFSIHQQSGAERAEAKLESFEEHSGIDPSQLLGGKGKLETLIEGQERGDAILSPDAVREALDLSPENVQRATGGRAQGQAQEEMLKQAESWMASLGQQPPAPPAPAAPDRIERLERLAKLHGDGALTDAEFQAEKKKILDE